MIECMRNDAKTHTRYDELNKIDKLTEIIYDTDYEGEIICNENPLRVNGECPVDEDEICKETCCKCIKAWLLEEQK